MISRDAEKMPVMNLLKRKIGRPLRPVLLAALLLLPAAAMAADGLSAAESRLSAAALEPSRVYPREHIILVWPADRQVDWYPESRVRGPEDLADWLEKCYALCVKWLKIDPDRELNAGAPSALRTRLVFIHNGMRDYNFGGKLLRPVIGLRDLRGAGSEDWFGWLTHELSHEFFLRFPEVTASPGNAAWHEALCDYMRYWLLKETGMPDAAARWRELLRRAPRRDRYKGGADIILDFHDRMGCQSPADLWALIRGGDFSAQFGQAPWQNDAPDAVPRGFEKIAFEAVVDGAGSFTFRGSKIHYEHFTWRYPERVRINGRPWTDLDRPFDLGFEPDFASARSVGSSGRNTMALIPHPDRMVLFIDDTDDAAAPYRITIAVKTTAPAGD